MLTHNSELNAAGTGGALEAFRTPTGSLDEFTLDQGCSRGVFLNAVEAGTHIVVGTAHSCYRFVVTDPARRRATVGGGAMFPEASEVRVDGATMGGTVIKSGWIGMGLRMELTVGSKRITTSPVKFLAID